jgi:hypothetical protein
VTTTSYMWLATIGAVACLASACAKASAPVPTPEAERTEPPRMLSRGSFPELSISGPNPAGRPSVRMRIQVLVDRLGRPDLKTLKLTGLGAAENRMAIERWIENATFRPAMRNGQPVSGLYETSLEVRVVVRRL